MPVPLTSGFHRTLYPSGRQTTYNMFLEGCGERQSVQWGPLLGQSEQSFSVLRHASESLGFLNGEAFLDVAIAS